MCISCYETRSAIKKTCFQKSLVVSNKMLLANAYSNKLRSFRCQYVESHWIYVYEWNNNHDNNKNYNWKEHGVDIKPLHFPTIKLTDNEHNFHFVICFICTWISKAVFRWLLCNQICLFSLFTFFFSNVKCMDYLQFFFRRLAWLPELNTGHTSLTQSFYDFYIFTCFSCFLLFTTFREKQSLT